MVFHIRSQTTPQVWVLPIPDDLLQRALAEDPPEMEALGGPTARLDPE
jgi:hypothetical protein